MLELKYNFFDDEMEEVETEESEMEEDEMEEDM